MYNILIFIRNIFHNFIECFYYARTHKIYLHGDAGIIVGIKVLNLPSLSSDILLVEPTILTFMMLQVANK